MLALQMRRASIHNGAQHRFRDLVGSLPPQYQPILRATRELQARLIGIAADDLVPANGVRSHAEVADAELFSDGRRLFALAVRRERGAPAEGEGDGERTALWFYAASPDIGSAIGEFERIVNERFEIILQPYRDRSDRLESFVANGFAPVYVTEEELRATRLLGEPLARVVANGVELAGSFLVRNLGELVPPETRDRLYEIENALHAEGLIQREVAVLCAQSGAMAARAPSRQHLEEWSGAGLRCGCGRAIAEEGLEEALATTPVLRSLLERGRWLSVLLLRELAEHDLPLERTLARAHPDGQVDLLVDAGGEIAHFFVRDADIGAEDASAVVGRIEEILPNRTFAVSATRVRDDARERLGHIEGQPVRSVEGADQLHEAVEDLVTEISLRRASAVFAELFPLAVADPGAVLRAVSARGSGVETDRAAESA